MQHLTDVDFFSATATGTFLVAFWAPWCGPCRHYTPILEFIDDRYGGVCKVNIDENPSLKTYFGIRVIPTTMLFHDGTCVFSGTGSLSKDTLIAEMERSRDPAVSQ
jgi:thioredoxin 1